MKQKFKEIVPYLLDWFDYNARILPWREMPLPYYVWVSEIMLQQTRVEAVKGYFDRFITALPGIKELSEAEEEKLLKLWEGLGYYNRVRNMQRSAQIMLKDFNGNLPKDYEALLGLPGIGEYTAGAIASIAYQIPVPAVDGNVLRVAMRITGSFSDITKSSTKKEVFQELKESIPKDRPGDFNQSLMELGAMVCLPNGRPLCDKCPVMHQCEAFHKDQVMDIPVKQAKKPRVIEEKTILLVEYQGRFAIRKRPSKGLLAGLWELPELQGRVRQEHLPDLLKDLNLGISSVEEMGMSKHIFTHREWHMVGYHIKLQSNESNLLKEQAYIWADKEDMNYRYALPNVYMTYSDRWRL